MTYRVTTLDSGWHVREALGDTWRWLHAPAPAVLEAWNSEPVPVLGATP